VTVIRSAPHDVLVVGWFPAADDTSAGRFVADQVAALQATGAVSPSVVSFENAAVRGADMLRGRQAAAVIANGEAALRAHRPFNPRGAAGPADVPLARLTVAAGEAPGTGPDHRAIHRTAALLPLMERPEAATWELVHAHVGYPEGVAAARAAARLGVPLILTEHATFLASLFAEPVVRDRYREAAMAAARVIAVSRMLADELLSTFPELGGRLVVIPNTVDVAAFGGGAPADRVPGELLWVGNRTETKGIATLLRAFAVVHERRPETVLRLIGRSFRPEHETGWQRLAGELGVAPAVRFEPPADRAGVAAAMRRADLFVHPSTRETFGVVAVEALASGLPVVASDSGGVTEVLGDDPDRLGALVPVADPAALAAAIIGALERRTSFDPASLRAHAEEGFGAARVARRIVELYEAVIAERAPQQGDDRARPRRDTDAPGEWPRRTIVVGFSRAELDRSLSRFPAWVFDGVELVTSGAPLAGRPDARLAPAGAESRVAQLLDWGAPATGRIGRLARQARRAGRRLVERRGGGADQADRILADLGRTLAAGLPATAGPDAPLLVCLGGIDHLVAAPFIADGRAVAAPGGLRWLADSRAAHAPTAAQESAAPASSDA
jgi:glycosyltransferase involved in cell wall biosynthesis